MNDITLNLRIHGRVQGVSYRDWTVKTANKIGLAGWVRNREDGTVEAVVSGAAADVRQLIEKCRKGPLMAKVNQIDETPSQTEDLPRPFERRKTA